MPEVYLVRHGQASLLSDNYDALSDHGKEQSRVLGRWFAARGKRFDHVVSGSLRRQTETAQEVQQVLDLDPAGLRVDPDFDEYGHYDIFASYRPDLADPAELGAYLRRCENPRREFQRMFAEAFDRWLFNYNEAEYPMSWQAFRESRFAAVTRVAERCKSGESAVIFTSAGVIASICQHLLQVPDEKVTALHFPLFNASVTKLLCQPGLISLSYFNSIGHLEADETAERSLVTYR